MFITNITPQTTGNVGNKVYDDGNVLLSCTTDTNSITVSLLVMTGPTHLKPRVTVNGVQATIVATGDAVVWTGTANVTLSGSGVVQAVHEDGDVCDTDVTFQAAPSIISAVFTGGYPGSQTELKAGDTYSMIVTSDIPMVAITVLAYGACAAQVYSFASTTSTTITVTIADQGDTPQLLSAQLKAADAYGSYGSVYDTITGGSVEGVNVVRLNDKYPVFSTIAQGNIAYPGSQQALKGSETADVTCTCDIPAEATFLYSSPNGDLSIANTTTYALPKTVTRIAGSYNISTTNFRIVATKTSNAAVTTVNGVVYVANAACTMAVTEPATRLRSGVTPQNHVITITASQRLLAAPTLVAPEGTWQGSGFSGSTTVWTRSLQISDSNIKGTYAWGAISGTNLAGTVTSVITGDSNYTIGGFVIRTIVFAAWPNRESAIGTTVSDTSKLQCTNLFKGASGSLNCTFEAIVQDHTDFYTITTPSGIYNPVGSIVRSNDLPACLANSAGTMTFEIAETV